MINSTLYRGTKIFQKFKSHLKILGASMVSWSKSHTEGPQILGALVQNLVARETWRPGFVQPWRCNGYTKAVSMEAIVIITII